MEQKSQLVKGRVSVIVPCYEVEEFLPDFLDSLVKQTYKDLEVIFVNDGSTDRTREILSEYEDVLINEGYLVRVMDQENRGLGDAVNAGLAIFTGEYLTWPDPDDWLTENSLQRRVELLNEHPDVGLLRSNCTTFLHAEQKYGDQLMAQPGNLRRPEGFFWDILLRRAVLAPISTMVRSSCFIDTCPSRQIFVTEKASQNIQILLPLVDAYPVLECGENLGFYRVREDSRSRRARSSEELLDRHETIFNVTLETLKTFKQRRYELESLLVVHYNRNVFLPLLCKNAQLVGAWRSMKNGKLPAGRSEIGLIIICLRWILKSAGIELIVIDRVFSRVVKTGDLFGEQMALRP